ncbi:protein brambleberry [Biomphalaria pfeifferi]|uniref:Protein brambleberry n=1 Tax=Biomphalaria pfeifferi TaxID=112525 RepID=A0AAD8BZY5_BIOPF|nr:protein brambleberry [Biomphalaria pfeifferi]
MNINEKNRASKEKDSDKDINIELANIRFEILSSEEKFVNSALSLTDLSPLDACYNIIIYNLKKKCGDLTEEELGKLSVQLLNCQLEVEERPVFPCTSSMSLADCTKSMDGTSWNSYQIVGNRARAMCYATQQVQFRRLTELTVSQLVSATMDQIKSLNDLKLGQEQLHSITAETVRKLYESHQDLLTTQIALKEAHEDVFKHIAANVKEILQEKALIASGNRELVGMTEIIKRKLDVIVQQAQEREETYHKHHEQILIDLKNIQDSIENVQNLDTKLQKLLQKYEKLDFLYEEMYKHLDKMNTTVNHVLISVSKLTQHFEDKMAWLFQFLGVTDNKLSTVSCCLLHIAYFFLFAVIATLLEIAVSVRLLMLVVIVGNIAAELNYNYSMDFAGLTVFLLALYFGFQFVNSLSLKFCSSLTRARTSLRRFSQPLTTQEINTMVHNIQRFIETLPDIQNGNSSFHPPTPPRSQNIMSERMETSSPARSEDITLNNSALENVIPMRQRLTDQLGSRASRSSTPLATQSRSSTPSSRCLAMTHSGTQCRNYASSDSDFCYLHNHS